jgi:hypothetical protein
MTRGSQKAAFGLSAANAILSGSEGSTALHSRSFAAAQDDMSELVRYVIIATSYIFSEHLQDFS